MLKLICILGVVGAITIVPADKMIAVLGMAAVAGILHQMRSAAG